MWAEPVLSEVEAVLWDDLRRWYPLVVDREGGGYLSDLSRRWRPRGPQRKMIVTQARHLWTASRAMAADPDDPRYAHAAAHGFAFLREVLWDEDEGGFSALVDRGGRRVEGPDRWLRKTAYGQAFAIYALAAHHGATGDRGSLALADDAFSWLDSCAHDDEHGGYFAFLDDDGTPVVDDSAGAPPKDQNSTIHLLEALTEFQRVRPDGQVEHRLAELLEILVDRIIAGDAFLRQFFTAAWEPVTDPRLDRVSFGHDVEAAFLLLDASLVLGRSGDDAERVRVTARALVDHALRHGWDTGSGGLFDEGAIDEQRTIVEPTKVWWAQAECLAALAVMAAEHPGDGRYAERLTEQWTYVGRHLLDRRHGGWFEYGLDRSPKARRGPKSHTWKGPYHTTRALLRVLEAGPSLPARA